MALEFPERDWKVFRQLLEVALERFCERVLDEICKIAAEPDRTNHERYLEIFKLLERRDDEMASGFNNPRRSMALFNSHAFNRSPY
jgi:hypothetical protein